MSYFAYVCGLTFYTSICSKISKLQVFCDKQNDRNLLLGCPQLESGNGEKGEMQNSSKVDGERLFLWVYETSHDRTNKFYPAKKKKKMNANMQIKINQVGTRYTHTFGTYSRWRLIL